LGGRDIFSFYKKIRACGHREAQTLQFWKFEAVFRGIPPGTRFLSQTNNDNNIHQLIYHLLSEILE